MVSPLVRRGVGLRAWAAPRPPPIKVHRSRRTSAAQPESARQDDPDDARGKRVTDSTPTAGEPMETGQASERVGDGNIKKSAQLTSFVDLGLQAALHPRNMVL